MAWLRFRGWQTGSADRGLLTEADRPAPRAWVDGLQRFLAPLDAAGRGTSRAVRDVVLTGEPTDGFAQVGPGTAAHAALGALLTAYGTPPPGLPALLAGLPDVRPDVVVRFGQLLGLGLAGKRWLFALDLPPGAEWVESLLLALTIGHDGERHRAGTVASSLPMEVLERAVEVAGLPAHVLLAAAFTAPPSTSYASAATRSTIRAMPGYDAAVARHASVLRDLTVRPGVAGRLLSLEMLVPVSEATLHLFTDRLAQLATSTSAQVRQVATPLLSRVGGDAVPALRTLATTGRPDQRLQALRLLWPLADMPTRRWARERAAQDAAASVQAVIREWDADEEADMDDERAVAPPRPVDWHVVVDPALLAALNGLWDRIEVEQRRMHEDAVRHAAAYEQRTGRRASWVTAPRPLDARWRKDVHRALTAGTAPAPVYRPVEHAVVRLVQREGLPRELGPVGLVVALNHLGVLLDRPDTLGWAARAAIDLHHQATGRPTLLELAQMLDAMGAEGGSVVYRAFAADYGPPLARTWTDDAVAPFVAAHLDLVTASLAGARRDYTMSADAPYRALRTLPLLPRHAVDALLATALTGAKADRRPAQDALGDVPGKEARILSALSDGKADVRTEAARWLARLRLGASLPALEAAVSKERNEVAKGAMLDALEALGQPVEKYLDRGALAAQAAAAVAKGLPKELDWLAWSAVPTVHWADGDVVPLEIVQWLVAQAVRAKSPEPNAILRKYCGMFEPRDREVLGQHLLESWLVEDVRPIDPDEAMRLAANDASTYRGWAAHDPDNLYAGMTVEQITERILPAYLRRPAGSIIGSKGVLAVVAACAGGRATAPVGRYLEEWYGTRAAQGKALIAMLAWVDHPSAVQLVLSIGSRFRTKSFQEEATRQAAALAERKGWTLDELADRTIPTAGLDASGTLRLPYGDRVFTAELQPDLTLRLRSPEGKPIAALPSPRRTDDAERAAASRATLQHARKELKQVVQLQTLRLYEAMCVDRTWSAEDWQRYLLGHPVVRHLAQRVVWLATDAETGAPDDRGAGRRAVRPLEDGTLTDVADDPVTLPPTARVRVAHDSLLDADEVRAWVAHLADYEVQPLFSQLERSAWSLPESHRGATELTDFTGHLVESFALRNRAGRLGYTRGPAEDGGWFLTYEKRFPTLGLTSVVAFTGSPLPEESRTVALETLSVVRLTPDGRTGGQVPLGQVPPVLLAEAYADIRDLAAAGTGFDPDWRRKVEA